MRDLLPTEFITRVKPNINSVEVHPQLSNIWHPVDGVLVGAGLLWPQNCGTYILVHLLKEIYWDLNKGNIYPRIMRTLEGSWSQGT
jgi:hypothetical protein